ncbi:MAG: GTP cyclohydrolase II [Microbacteriaceae bacterium]
MALSTIPEAIAALRSGKPILVADNEARENEGDAIMAAEFASSEWIGWMVRHTSGYLCAPTTNEIADRLELPLMVPNNTDPLRTAYTISVDAAEGVTTGISATDRAHTLRLLAQPETTALELTRPGHILPLRAKAGGILERPGHTEATVDLMKIAGLQPVGVIGEMVHDNGEMMRLPALYEIGERVGLPVITIEQLSEWLQQHPEARDGSLCTTVEEGQSLEALQSVHKPVTWYERLVHFEVETTVPTTHGTFRFRGYRDLVTGHSHLAVVSGDVLDEAPLVRIHSECLTGEAFGSEKCECGPQLDAALDRIAAEGGVVIYLRGHEGRGIGLINKLKAYRLQEDGIDTMQANLDLNLPADARQYGAAAAILADLGVERVRLLTNNPNKQEQIGKLGVDVVERVPMIVGVNENNRHYLEAKRDRMGHILPSTI